MRFKLLLLIFLTFVSCDHADEINPLSRAHSISEARNIIAQHDQDNVLLVSVEKSGLDYTFIFEDGSQFILGAYFVSDVITAESEWVAVVHYIDGTRQPLGYLGDENGLQVTEVVLNPSGAAPLCATVEVTTLTEGAIEVRVKGKHNTSEDLLRTFKSFGKVHHLGIVGLYGNHANVVELTFTNKDGKERLTKTINVQTGPLPDNLPEIIVDVAKPEKMEEGMTLISYLGANSPVIPFVMDNSGEIRWYLDYADHPTLGILGYDNGIERLQNGNFYFGDIRTNSIYEVDLFGQVINTWTLPGYKFHHQVLEKPDGNFVVTVNKSGSTHLNGVPTVEDYVIEVDRASGVIVEEWDLKQSLDEYRTAMMDNLAKNPIDWFHANGLAYDERDNTIIVSGRTQGVVKLTYDNTVKWILGPHKGWGMSRDNVDLTQFLLNPVDNSGKLITDQDILDGDENSLDFEWNWYQHAPKIMPNGNVILFDNGDRRNFTGIEKYSRAVEFEIDELQMTVRQVWSYGKERGTSTYSAIVSEVDYLPGKNNILFSPGSRVDNDGKLGGKVVEVSYDSKEVVFEVRINTTGFVALHRAERLELF